MGRSEFIAKVGEILGAIQDGLFQKALAHREEHTRTIKSLEKFKKFFTPKNAEKPEAHGGFAKCYFVDCAEVDEMLKPLKVTPRCIPLDQEESEGICIFTGKPTKTIGVFGKSY